MKLYELLEGLTYTAAGAEPETEVTVPSTDSRSVVPGGVFICLRGTRRDGHRYAREAVSAGARAVICEEYIEGLPCIVTADTRLGAALVWNNYFGCPGRDMRLLAVTGTNGKTSFSVFAESIFRTAGIKTGLIGTLGCRIDGAQTACRGAEVEDVPAAMTTPDPEYLFGVLAEMKRAGVQVVVMEASSHSIGLKKTEPLCFECAAFTNLSPEHLDFHSDMEEYFKVKSSLFNRCRSAVINTDDAYGARLARQLDGRMPAEYVSKGAARGLSVTARGTEYTFVSERGELDISCGVTGGFTLYNTMSAVQAARLMGIEDRYIRAGISAVKRIPGRMERVLAEEAWGYDAFIDYAHTPAALEGALRTLREIGKGRKITVLFGCGGDRDRLKRPLMGEVCERLADRVIVTSDNPRTENREAIIDDILAGMSVPAKRTVISDRREAVAYAVETAQRGEILLLAGKGHEAYETDINGKHPFSEKAILVACAARRGIIR